MSKARRACRIITLAVAAAAIFYAPAASAFSRHAYCLRWARAHLDPHDLNVMRSSVSAASRLAVAQRLRPLVAQCEAALAHHPPPP